MPDTLRHTLHNARSPTHSLAPGKGARVILVNVIDEDTAGSGMTITVVFSGSKSTVKATMKAANALHAKLL